MSRHRYVVLGLAVLAMILSVATVAMAAAAYLYLSGDGEPAATMSLTVPGGGGLPDFDSDGDPGRTIQRGGSGYWETDPDLFQQWEYDVSGLTIAVTNLSIWGTDDEMDGDDVEFDAYLLLCDPNCSLLDHASKSINNSKSWKQSTLSLSQTERAYGPGSRLIVKIVVPDDSDDNMWFAYDTQTYKSSLTVNSATSIPSSTTTAPGSSTTTSPASSTTTDAGTSTTTTRPRGPSTTTTHPHGPPTTTQPPGPPTTEPPGPPTSTTQPPATSTTTEGDSSTTTRPIALGGAIDSGDPPSGSAGSGEATGEDEGFFGVDTDQQSVHLAPQKGLGAAYATVAENVEIYWQVAVALGALMAVLLIAGFDEEESESDPSRRILWHRRLDRI